MTSPNLAQRSSMVYRPTNAVPNMPTHLTLQTQPMDRPVIPIQSVHSGENGFCCWLWNLAQQKTVVKVKKSSMESRRMNLLMVVYEFSNSTAMVTSQTVGRLKCNSLAVKYARGINRAPKVALNCLMNL